MVKVRSIHIERFKSFEDFTVELGDFNVIVGPNNAGKSSLLQAIMLAHECQMLTFSQLKRNRIEFAARSTVELNTVPVGRVKDLWFNHRNRKGNNPIPLTIGLEFEIDPAALSSDSMQLVQNQFNFSGNEAATLMTVPPATTISGQPYSVEVAYSIRTMFTGLLATATPKVLPPTALPILGWSPIYIPGFVGVVPREDRVRPISTLSLLRSGRQNQILRNMVFDAFETGARERITYHLQRLFGAEGLEFPFNERTDLYLRAEYKEPGRKEPLDFVSIGSGFLQIAQILATIYNYRPSLILLDEGDAHLHSDMQRRLVTLLRDLQKELNFQIVIATHAEQFIRGVPLENVLYVDKSNKQAIRPASFTDLHHRLRLVGVSLDNVAYSNLLRTKKVIFVENQDDFSDVYWPLLLVLRNELTGREGDVLVQETEGVTRPVLQDIKKSLEQITGAPISTLFIRDRDVLTTDDIQALNPNDRTDLTILTGPRRELENYLLEPRVLQAAIASALSLRPDRTDGPNVTTETVLELLTEAQRELVKEESYGYARAYADEHRQKDKRHDEVINEATYEFLTIIQREVPIAHSVVRGSVLLKAFRRKVQERYAVSLGIPSVVAAFTEGTIPEDLKSMLLAIGEFLFPTKKSRR